MKAIEIQVFLVAKLETKNSIFYEKYDSNEILAHYLVIWSRMIYHQTTTPHVTLVLHFTIWQ